MRHEKIPQDIKLRACFRNLQKQCLTTNFFSLCGVLGKSVCMKSFQINIYSIYFLRYSFWVAVIVVVFIVVDEIHLIQTILFAKQANAPKHTFCSLVSEHKFYSKSTAATTTTFVVTAATVCAPITTAATTGTTPTIATIMSE